MLVYCGPHWSDRTDCSESFGTQMSVTLDLSIYTSEIPSFIAHGQRLVYGLGYMIYTLEILIKIKMNKFGILKLKLMLSRV